MEGLGVRSDDELYRSYLSGEQPAGDQLMLRYAHALTAYIAAFLHDNRDAEDLMLECFAVILVDKPRIADGHFRAYLFRVARNMACRLWKRKARLREFSLDETLVSRDATPEDAVMASERDAALHRCLNRIAPQYREALYLFYEMDLSYAQIAQVLGCRVKKVEDLLRNGRKRLQTELEKEGIAHADI